MVKGCMVKDRFYNSQTCLISTALIRQTASYVEDILGHYFSCIFYRYLVKLTYLSQLLTLCRSQR